MKRHKQERRVKYTKSGVRYERSEVRSEEDNTVFVYGTSGGEKCLGGLWDEGFYKESNRIIFLPFSFFCLNNPSIGTETVNCVQWGTSGELIIVLRQYS